MNAQTIDKIGNTRESTMCGRFPVLKQEIADAELELNLAQEKSIKMYQKTPKDSALLDFDKAVLPSKRDSS